MLHPSFQGDFAGHMMSSRVNPTNSSSSLALLPNAGVSANPFALLEDLPDEGEIPFVVDCMHPVLMPLARRSGAQMASRL
jgi:hypothetical protein